MRHERSGLTLIEVLVALSILALGATAWIALAAQGWHTQAAVTSRARRMQRASLAMTSLSIQSRERIAAMGGVGLFQGFHVRVVPLSASLVEVSLSDSAGGAEILRTSFHFSDAARSP